MMESNNYEYLVWREHPTKSKRKLSISSCENLNFGCHFEKAFKNDKIYLMYSRRDYNGKSPIQRGINYFF